jgi:hypothetical protein
MVVVPGIGHAWACTFWGPRNRPSDTDNSKTRYRLHLNERFMDWILEVSGLQSSGGDYFEGRNAQINNGGLSGGLLAAVMQKDDRDPNWRVVFNG